METSASFEARSAPSPYPTTGMKQRRSKPYKKVCSLDRLSHAFQAYAVSIGPMNSRGEARFSDPVEKKTL